MIDLTSAVGLAVFLDPESGSLEFGPDVAVQTTGVRRISDLLSVLAVPDQATGREDEIAYRLYRGVRQSSDIDAFDDAGLRYDLVVTMPGEIGGELIKTAGHTHSHAADGVVYPEVYEVVHGSAAFVLQFADPFEVVIALCAPGDRIVIPPGASHVTVNRGELPLVTANLIAAESENTYDRFFASRGAAVYLFQGTAEHPGFRQHLNPGYPVRPIWRTIEGSRIGMLGGEGKTLYRDAVQSASAYRFLTAPASFDAEMQALWVSRNVPEN